MSTMVCRTWKARALPRHTRVYLGQYLKSHHVNAQIHEISGSVEIAPGISLADAVCDIVSSGSTLLSNGLKEVETIFRSRP